MYEQILAYFYFINTFKAHDEKSERKKKSIIRNN